MLGRELASAPGIGLFEKIYILLFGVPISGLRIRLRRVLPYLQGKPSTILDAGCGRGVFSYEAAKKFPTSRVVGVDIDTDQLAKNRMLAELNHLKNLEFVQGDICDLPFENEFDMAISIDNLEHLEDDSAGLNSLYRALRKDGRLVVHVPGFERRWILFNYRTNFDVPGHFRPGYRCNEIVEKVRAAGFEVDTAFYTFGWLETVANNFSYLITRAEAKNKFIYALVFPVLNIMAWLGVNAKPEKGAGVLVLAKKI